MSDRKLLVTSALLRAATNAGFAFFADGIVVGVWAMLRLRGQPEVLALAGGRR